jgi:hypothetical protein
MALDRAPEYPALTLIDGRLSDTARKDEARIEAIAFLDEAEASALLIIDALVGLPVPSLFAVNEAGKIAHRAALARAEILALGGGSDAA